MTPSDLKVTPNLTPAIDVNVEANRQALLDRSNVGIQKYGVTTDKANLLLRDWLNHALEETLDNANYLRAAMRVIDEVELPELSDEQIDTIANDMPGGLDGFLMEWGWRQFARAILTAANGRGLAEKPHG